MLIERKICMLDETMRDDIPESDETLPWLLFRVQDNVYTINSKAVSGIMMMPSDITSMPDSSGLFRGIANVRGDVYPVMDLRALFKLKSTQQEYSEFCEMMDKRKADHEKWIQELDRCVKTGDKFTLATDPHQCAFGKWYDKFESTSSVLNFHMRKIEEPHRLLHETAEKVLSCKRDCDNCKNDVCLQKLMKLAEEQYVPQVVGLIDDAKELFSHRYREMMVVITDGENLMGLIVDEVLTVEPLEEICKKTQIQAFYRQDYIIGVARSKRVAGDILMLDDTKILARRSEFDE